MRARTIILASLLALAGCADGRDEELPSEESNAQAERHISMLNEHHEQLLQLPPDAQRLAMMRAIRRTGNRCQRVDNAGYQQEHLNMRMWVAQCGVEEKLFAVYIAPNGDVQVRDCAQAGQLSLPRCEGLAPATPTQNMFQEGAADKAYRNEM
jgi:hypothetical protein